MSTGLGFDGAGTRLTHSLAIAAGVLALPLERFDPLWLALFAVPGLLFLWLTTSPQTRAIGFASGMAIAVLLQLSLVVGLFRYAAGADAETALTYLLLAPLAFSSFRREDIDVLLSLFLVFCLLLIGAMLRSALPVPQIIAFVVGATWTLRSEARRDLFENRVGVRAGAVRPSRRAISAAGTALACLLGVAGVFSVLEVIPMPGRDPDDRGRVGLSDRFELDGKSPPRIFVYDEKVVVRSLDSNTAPRNLYLRRAYFDQAGLGRWTKREPEDLRALPLRGTEVIRRPLSQLSKWRLGISRKEPDSGYVYMPPGTYMLAGDNLDLLYSDRHEYAREVRPDSAITYMVKYQNVRNPRRGEIADGWEHLTRLPRNLPSSYQRLAFAMSRSARNPLRVAHELMRGLRDRCSYSLDDPVGNAKIPLTNFLFGNRRGYCMYFASAMAIMLRIRDVPCRIGVGLYGGRSDEEDPRNRVFGSRDAHAWVEIPINGVGWVVFDPTPPANLQDGAGLWPTPSPNEPNASGEDPEADSAGKREGRSSFELPRGTEQVAPWLGLALLFLLTMFRPPRRRANEVKTPPRPQARTARRKLVRVLRVLADRGYPRLRNQPLELLADAITSTGKDAEPFGAAFRAYQDVRFGGYEFDTERERTMDRAHTAARDLERRS